MFRLLSEIDYFILEIKITDNIHRAAASNEERVQSKSRTADGGSAMRKRFRSLLQRASKPLHFEIQRCLLQIKQKIICQLWRT